MRYFEIGFLAFSVCLASAGCAGSSELMAEAPSGTPPVASVPDAATVVFVRDSGLGFGINFTIVDQAGHFVGDAVAKTHFAVRVPPGDYTFIAEGENTAVVRASVGAGRIYYVHVTPEMGVLSARVALDPVKPTEPEWSTLSTMLGETQQLVPLMDKGQAVVDKDPAEAKENVQDGLAKWAELTVEQKNAQTLALEDGAGNPVVPPPAASPPAPAASAPPTSASAEAPPAVTPLASTAPLSGS